jgi:hypothetical protein
LAADELLSGRQSDGAAPSSSLPARAAKARPIAERPARFTTVEEDEMRRRAEAQRSWILVAVQLAALAAVLAGMGAVAMYLSRAPSADELHRTVTARRVVDDDASLATTEREIAEFLRRFPDDPRAANVAEFHEEILLDKAERRLLREGRGQAADGALIPVEQLYLQAVHTEATAPDASVSILQSLIDLYAEHVPARESNGQAKIAGSPPGNKRNEQSRAVVVVQLAQRRLAALNKRIADERNRQLTEIRERLDTAAQVAESDLQKSTAMYGAIIDLYGDDAWAADAVAEARKRLEQMEQTDD